VSSSFLTPIIGWEYNFFVQGNMVFQLRGDRPQAIAKSKIFYDDVMQLLSIAPPFFSFFFFL
jgi:hypothetical protein